MCKLDFYDFETHGLLLLDISYDDTTKALLRKLIDLGVYIMHQITQERHCTRLIK
jgi:hypothetical protein